jgi:hypothetical protein
MPLVQKVGGQTNTGATVTLTLNGVLTTNALLYGQGCISIVTFSAPTDTGSGTWAQSVTEQGAAGTQSAGLAHCLNPGSGTHAVSDSLGSGVGFKTCALAEWNNSLTSLDQTNSANSGSSAVGSQSTGSITPSQSSETIFAMVNANGSGTWAIDDPPTGYTSIYVQNNAQAFAAIEACAKDITSGGAQSVTWNFGSGNTGSAGALIASFKSSAGGAAPFTIEPGPSPDRFGWQRQPLDTSHATPTGTFPTPVPLMGQVWT